MHVSGRNRGIVELDLGSVFTTDEERQALSMVKSLDLSYNALRTVNTLQALAQLKTLDLSRNKITKISGLPLSITRLDVSHNELMALDGIALLPNLIELDVSSNKITSLQHLSRVTTLQIVKANGNRIAHANGLEFLTSLKLLALEHNYLASADDLLFLSSLPCLESVAFRGSPVTTINGYRDLVARLQRNIGVLDGSPLMLGGEGPSKVDDVSAVLSRGASSRPSTADSGAVTGARTSGETKRRSVLINELRGQRSGISDIRDDEDDESEDDDDAQRAVEAVRRRTEALAREKEELQDQLRAVTRQLHEALIMADNEQRESSRLRLLNGKLEQQLSDARRVISDEVRELAELRREREELLDTVGTLRSRLDKSVRTAKYSQAKFQSETSKMALSIERERAVHDVEMSDLRSRIGDNIRRAVNRSTTTTLNNTALSSTSAGRLPHRRRQSPNGEGDENGSSAAVDVTSSTFVASPDKSGGSDSSGANKKALRPDLAGQLKSWLLTEMEKAHSAAAEDRLVQAMEEDLPPASLADPLLPVRHFNSTESDSRPTSSNPRQQQQQQQQQQQTDDVNASIRRSKKAAKDISAIWMRNEQILRQ